MVNTSKKLQDGRGEGAGIMKNYKGSRFTTYKLPLPTFL